MNETEISQAPPYVGYASFKDNALGLVSGGELPPQIDNTVLESMSGSTRNQFMSALRYLGLVVDRKPTPTFAALVANNGANWKKVMWDLIREKYPNQMEPLQKGTIDMLAKSFGDIGTIRANAVRFLLYAAKDVGMPISPFNAKSKVANTNGKTRKAKKPEEPGATGGAQPAPSNQPASPSGMVSFPIHIPGKAMGTITLPDNINESDLEMVEAMFAVVKVYAGNRK